MGESIDPVLLSDMDAYWRAANYLSVGQMYLLANPLLREPLKFEHVKPLVLGNWHATAGQNFIYVHLNRMVKEYDLNMIYIAGPTDGGVALIANAYLEGTYSELYPDIAQDEEGLLRLFKQFSLPGDRLSCVASEAPGSPREASELGDSLSYAHDVICGNSDLLAACVVGDAEAETIPSWLRWRGHECVNPTSGGAVLPILHLTGYEGVGRDQLRDFLHGNGFHPYFVEGADPAEMHPLLAQTLDAIVFEIGHLLSATRSSCLRRPRPWPALVVCTPRGWTAPMSLDWQQIEGPRRAHQLPLPEVRRNPAQLAMLENWLRSYRPEELFDPNGRLHSDLADLAPRGARRMGNYSRLIGGALLRDFR